MQYKFKSGTTEVQGISFRKGEIKFKGSEIDRGLSYGKLNARIGKNQKQFQGWVQQLSVHPAIGTAVRRSPMVAKPSNLATEFWHTLMNFTPEYEVYDPFKPKKKKQQNKGLSR